MPPEKSKNNQATNSAAALASCEDLMLCVLARLPVKSIIRFKSVCKSWNHLLSTQEFIKMQFKLSNKSKNQSFLVHRVDSNTISFFNIGSNEKILDQQFNDTPVGIDIVGCCNGLVCIKRGQEFVLWNPAMNLSKTVPLMKDDRVSESFLLGFGYDAKGDDFKVVRLLLNNRRCVSCVEVYSVNSDSWTTIDQGFRFSKLKIYQIEIRANVNGNPYWIGIVDGNDVLICLEVSKFVFKIVPLSSLDDNNEAKQEIEFVDLNGSLGALVYTFKSQEDLNERIVYVDTWVFDEVEQIWTKSHSVGQIKEKIMNWVLRCLKDGRVLGKQSNGELIVFNYSETKCVEDLFYIGHNFEIYDYTASMAYIKGMEKVTLTKRRH